MSSGVQTLTNGKSEFFAICAASAVFPLFGGPSKRTETSPDPSVARACWMHRPPSASISTTGLPQWIIPRVNNWVNASALVPNA